MLLDIFESNKIINDSTGDQLVLYIIVQIMNHTKMWVYYAASNNHIRFHTITNFTFFTAYTI